MKIQTFLNLLLLHVFSCSNALALERTEYLISGLEPGSLKTALAQCASEPLRVTDFSIGHRGAPMGYPEHSKEGYLAAIKMGAGLIECDVVLTKDRQLVCRHSQCDLHRTTNILQTDLASQCQVPFAPGDGSRRAKARCCTNDFTLAQLRGLCARRDVVNDRAQSVDQYLLQGLPSQRLPQNECGTLLSHRESIQLISNSKRKHIPELKKMSGTALRALGVSVEEYADMLVAEYRDFDISPDRVYLQSFDQNVVNYWLETYPDYASKVVFLDGRGRRPGFRASRADMDSLYEGGLRVIAPPIPMLLEANAQGGLRKTDYATYAVDAGLDLITWTFDSRLSEIAGFSRDESDGLRVLDALNKEARVRGVFSDWPEVVTRYANCMNL